MADPLDLLRQRFLDAVAQAFPDHAGTDPAIRRSDRADYQANVAMSLAKKVGRPPRDVAAAIQEKLDLSGLADEVTVSGPGFLNVVLANGAIAREASAAVTEPRAGVTKTSAPETVVIDYSSPNVAKEMHVGHLPSTILGDALARVFEFLGHRVVRQNHLGDWGTPFGMLIEHLLDLGQDTEAGSAAVADLGAFYKTARGKFDADPAFAERARKRVVLLQAGDEKTLALWATLVDTSKAYFARVYGILGVTLQEADICAESFYNPRLPEIVKELEDKGLAVESDGALCVFPPGFKTKAGDPLPLIVRKKDGGYGYATTDLAAIRHRVVTLGARRVLYVVGAPQKQHLEMVFAVARLAGWLPADVLVEHVAFGLITKADGTAFASREGEVVRLLDILDEAVSRARGVVAAKPGDLGDAERAEVGRVVGIGAVKYQGLSNDRIKDVRFDFDRMLALDGNTAPYLQYAHARIRSIFRKAEAEGVAPARDIALVEPAERALALELLGFGAAALDVAASREPHRLCTYLYGVATRFTAFYEKCPVLRAEDPAVRASRLALSGLTARVLATGLDLLGIEHPDRM